MMYIIVKNHKDDKEPVVEKELKTNSSVAEQIMNDPGFKNYVAKHGYHFTDKLAECASGFMENSDGSSHRWTATQVKNALRDVGYTDFGDCTIGDMTYLANMAYADFYPLVVPNETACIKYAYAVSHDKDGYDGMVFSRWLSDIIGKQIIDIKWEDYV